MCSDLRQDVPDDELLAGIFSEASRTSAPCSPPPWALSGQAAVPLASSRRTLSIHLSTHLVCQCKPKELLFVMGKERAVFPVITPHSP